MTDPTHGADGRTPLFYRDPRPLSSIDHATWRLVAGDFSFARHTPFVPLALGEFVPVARHYPIVFTAGAAVPVAVLGLEPDNLFVSDGEWEADHYVPAYVRRYPFGFMRSADPDRYILAIDAASNRLVQHGGEGVPLFVDGQPSAHTRQALTFCNAYQAEVGATEALSKALIDHKLLSERRVDAQLPDGRALGLNGLQVVEPERLLALSDAVVLDWHRRGWLGLVHHHLASLDRFEVLLARQGQRATAEVSLERLDA
jgi:hypothetical protein